MSETHNIVGTFGDVTGLRSLSVVGLSQGNITAVGLDPTAIYFWKPIETAADDGVYVIQPNDGGASGRWVLVGYLEPGERQGTVIEEVTVASYPIGLAHGNNARVIGATATNLYVAYEVKLG